MSFYCSIDHCCEITPLTSGDLQQLAARFSLGPNGLDYLFNCRLYHSLKAVLIMYPQFRTQIPDHCLPLACGLGWLDIVKMMVEGGTDINSRRINIRSAQWAEDVPEGQDGLMMAYAYQRDEVARYLIKAGINQNNTDRQGHTAQWYKTHRPTMWQ